MTVEQARLSLHLSKCHIVGNHMSRLVSVRYLRNVNNKRDLDRSPESKLVRSILNETSKPPLTKHVFQYNSSIIKMFEMIFGTVYLGTCVRRLNITKFDIVRMFIYA